MAFTRDVLISDIVYGYHKATSISMDKDGTVIYVSSWKNEEESESQFYTGRTTAIPMPDTAQSAEQSLLDAETWALNNGYYPEYIDEAQAALDAVLPILTDEQAEQVPDAFPLWAAGVAYKVGDRIRYTGSLYKCVQAHTSQEGWEPPVATSLWSAIGEPGEIPEWVQPTGSHDAYSKDDLVRHSNKIWRSLVDANVWEPGAPGTETLWAEE